MVRRPVTNPSLLTTLAAFLFAVLSCALGPAPARAQIDVSAPTGAEAHVIGDWYQRHMPARFRTRQAVSVTLLAPPAMDAYIGQDADPSDNPSHTNDDDGSIDGVFENDPPRITLRLPDAGTPDPTTFAHEYGHYVWFQLLSKADRQRYAALYARQRAAHHLVTDYAADCLEEGFAEAFSCYLCQPATLDRADPLSFQFLSRWSGK